MAEFDTDGSGDIDFDEFLAILGSKMNNDNDYLMEAFKIFDRDGNGFISKQELKYVVMNLEYPPTDEKLEEMINTVDANRDGMLSIVEFASLMSLKAFDG